MQQTLPLHYVDVIWPIRISVLCVSIDDGYDFIPESFFVCGAFHIIYIYIFLIALQLEKNPPHMFRHHSLSMASQTCCGCQAIYCAILANCVIQSLLPKRSSCTFLDHKLRWLPHDSAPRQIAAKLHCMWGAIKNKWHPKHAGCDSAHDSESHWIVAFLPAFPNRQMRTGPYIYCISRVVTVWGFNHPKISHCWMNISAGIGVQTPHPSRRQSDRNYIFHTEYSQLPVWQGQYNI